MKLDFYSLRRGYLRITLVLSVLAGTAFAAGSFYSAGAAGAGVREILKTVFGGAGIALAAFVGLWMMWMGGWIVMWVAYFVFTLARAGLSRRSDRTEPADSPD